MSISLVF